MTRAPEEDGETDVDSAPEGAPRSEEDGQGREAGRETSRAHPHRDAGRDLISLALLRLAVSAGVWMSGLVALSDDDYARVTIAQRFAATPRFDPSGTSWLPFPFWIMGGAMKLLDPSLEVARLVTAVLSVAATWLLFAAGRMWGFSEKRAFAAAALTTLVPAAAVLGSMTVPELPTAALCLFAIVAATAPHRETERHRATLLAGGAMFAATMSRYEAWPVAVVVAVVVWKRWRGEPLWKRTAIAALPLLGPALWLVHSRIAHGDAISFLRRVSSYRTALGLPDARGPGTYFMALAGGSPAVMLTLVVLLVSALRARDREAALQKLARFRAWAASVAALLVFLLAGQLAGGAPTHHPERALLVIWLLATFAVVDLVSFLPVPLWLIVPMLVLLGFDYRGELADHGVQRQTEERVGLQLRALLAKSERVFAATNDYGYFAIMAAFGRPDDVVVDSQDPRSKRSTTLLGDPWNAVTRLRGENASWLVAPSSVVLPLALRERMRDGRLVIYELDPRR